MKHFRLPLALASALVLALASCQTTLAPSAAAGTVDHVVLVWLKHPGDAAERQILRAAGDRLRAIPGLTMLDHGTPLASARPVVDDTFDVGFVMRFASKEALDAYERHPAHVQEVQKALGPLSRKVVVYDIIR